MRAAGTTGSCFPRNSSDSTLDMNGVDWAGTAGGSGGGGGGAVQGSDGAAVGGASGKSGKYWERSQSAADLEQKDKTPRYTSTSMLECSSDAGNKVSEHSSVYWDLSKAEEEATAAAARHGGKFKISLQTIRQKEEMMSSTPAGGVQGGIATGTGVGGGTTSPTVSIQARVVRRMSSTETTTTTHGAGGSTSKTTEYSEYSLPAPEFAIPSSTQLALPPPSPTTASSAITLPNPSTVSRRTFTFTVNQSNKPNLTVTLASAIPVMRENIQMLAAPTVVEKCTALEDILAMIEQAWAMPLIGRDLAYGLCDVLRTDGGLEILIENCADQEINRDVALGSARVLAQSMTVANRDYVAKKGLEVIVRLAARVRDDPRMSQATTGILESLFKHSHNTCSSLIKTGGLDTVLYSCRTSNNDILRHCAVALANLAIYGGEDNQHAMIVHKAHEWLFPLAFSNDDSIRYYAFLAIAALSANKELEAAVVKSGTLGLVEPFIRSHDPITFGKSDYAHAHGQSKDWLSHLVPLLRSKREEALSLAAFHFAMEAGIQRGKLEIFREIGAIEPLKRIASSTFKLAAKFASQALELIGEEVPQKLSPRVPLWTTEEIRLWLRQTTLSEDIVKCIDESSLDGDLLLLLSEENLKDEFNMKSCIARKKFMRELEELKKTADYDSCDPSHIDDWLKEIGEEFRQYTYQMVRSGVDRRVLRMITDENLLRDCGIQNGIHRLKILEAAKRLSSMVCSPVGETDPLFERCIDAFISYRRSTGSQLASLLKVHLQLRGFTVFLDIEKLRAGKFDDNLLNSIRNTRTFILVLTSNALDRCVGDSELKDWIHREVVAALEGGCNIIPVMDNFEFPAPETLPEDMRPICFFNSIRWIHDYQDACVDKLENFMNGELSAALKQPINRACMSKVNSMTSPAPDPHGPHLMSISPEQAASVHSHPLHSSNINSNGLNAVS